MCTGRKVQITSSSWWFYASLYFSFTIAALFKLRIQTDGCFLPKSVDTPSITPNACSPTPSHPSPHTPLEIEGNWENVVLVEYDVFISPIVCREKCSKNTSCMEEIVVSYFYLILHLSFLVHIAMTLWIVFNPQLLWPYFTICHRSQCNSVVLSLRL